MEVQRICEAAATPNKEGANLSEYSNNKRIDLYDINSPLLVGCFLYASYNEENDSEEKVMIQIAKKQSRQFKEEKEYGKIIIHIRISNRGTPGQNV